MEGGPPEQMPVAVFHDFVGKRSDPPPQPAWLHVGSEQTQQHRGLTQGHSEWCRFSRECLKALAKDIGF